MLFYVVDSKTARVARYVYSLNSEAGARPPATLDTMPDVRRLTAALLVGADAVVAENV